MLRMSKTVGRNLSVVGGTAVLALLAASCSSGGSEGNGGAGRSGDSGTVTVSVKEDPDTLDPTFAQSVGARYAFVNMCKALYDINEHIEVVPQLAVGMPVISNNGRTAVINLRKGVVFNDGTPFNADAVVTTIKRDMTAEGSARKGELGAVSSVSASGEYSVTFSLKRPYAPLAAVLADRAGMIMSPKALDELGKNFTQKPVCVGPYRFVKRVPGTELDLEKSPLYYDADKVHVQRLVMKAIPDGSVRAANFESGAIDIVDKIDPPDFSTIKNMHGVVAQQIPALGFDELELNLASETFKDPRVRQAFSLSLDLSQINKVVYSGTYDTTCQPFPKTSPYFLGDVCPGRDVAKSKSLLAAAGVATPVTFDLLVLNDSIDTRRAELIQAQAAEAGFKVNVTPLESGSLLSRATAGTFGAVVLTWSGRVDPDGNTSTFLHTGGGQNFGRVSDPQLDQLLDSATATTDQAARKELYRQAWTIQLQQTYSIALGNPNILTSHYDQVKNLNVFGDGLIRLTGVDLGK
jgi:peptide/nickel transport system substrate-binding protein